MRGNVTKWVLILSVSVLAAGAMAAPKPTFDLDWYGYVKLDAAYDQQETSHGNFAMWVKPQQNNTDDEQFNMTHKQTRFGFKANGQGYENVNVSGQVEVDLYGAGGAENKAELQLRHAFFTVQSQGFELLAGQTWDLISPLNPATLNYSVLWGCGNIGYRRPQIRLSYTVNPNEQSSLKFAAGAFRTIGNDLTPTLSLATEVADGTDDGTDAGIPSMQGALDFQHQFSPVSNLRVGVSGMFGQLKAEGSLGTDETYESQAIVGHLAVKFSPMFGFKGEGYTGANLGSYYGGITNSSTVDGVDSKGGWASLWVKPSPKVTFNVGGGMDDPDDADLATSAKSKNQCFFGNVQWCPVPQVTLGVEGSQWETTYLDDGTTQALRMQTSFVLNF